MVYMRAVELAGGLPVVLPPLSPACVGPLIEQLAGVCLSGGPDLAPAGYGASPDPDLGPTEPRLDAFETSVVHHADRLGLPVLGICRGLQALNVARGGTLLQHLPDVTDRSISHRQIEPGHRSTHTVRLAPGSRVARVLGATELEVNSFHHQAIERLGDGLHAVGWAPDGVIEAIEARRRPARDGRAMARGRSRRPPRAPRALPGAGHVGGGGRSYPAGRLRCAASPGRSARAARPTAPRSSACRRCWPRAAPTGRACGSTARAGWRTAGSRSSTCRRRARQPMVDEPLGLTVVFNGCLYNYKELRAELERAGHHFESTSDTEVILKGWAQWRERMLDRFAGMFAFALWEAETGRLRPGPRPARHQAALPGRRPGRRDPLRVHAPGPGRRRRHRRRRRPGRTAPLPELALGRARAADDPARRAQAPARHAAGGRAGRAPARAALVGPAVHARPGPRRVVAGGLGGGRARRAADGGRPPHGGRRPGRRAAVRRARLVADRRAARRIGPARPGHVLDRLPRRGRPRGRRVPLLRPDRARVRDGPPPDPRRRRSADRRPATRHRRDERADDLPRRGGLLPAQRGGGARSQGRAVRSGRRRGARRLLLVPAAARRARRRPRHLRGRVLRPRRRGRRRARGRSRSRAIRAARSPRSGSRGPARRRPSTARCASMPR